MYNYIMFLFTLLFVLHLYNIVEVGMEYNEEVCSLFIFGEMLMEMYMRKVMVIASMDMYYIGY